MKDCKYALEIMKQELDNKHISPEIKYAFQASIEALEKQLNNGWIPVSERLPKDRLNENGEPVEYNVMLRRATEPTTLSIDEHDKWFDWRGQYYNIASLMAYEFDVIAWQPLPKPYQPE